MPKPWNNWVHGIVGTYGSWLPGDPRGFRTWKHKQHIEGDYKQPPPAGLHDAQHRSAKQAMKRDAVKLTPVERQVVAEALAEKLRGWEIMFVNLAVDATHFHLLVKIPSWESAESRGMAIPRLSEKSALQDGRDPLPRHLIGLLKKHASHTLRQQGLTTRPGGLWAKRGKIIPIEDRGHQVATAKYIEHHATQGAAVIRGV